MKLGVLPLVRVVHPQTHPVWQRRPSPLARTSLIVFLLLIIDASLYPFTGWRDIGLAPFAYLQAPWPPHALEFDILDNICGYAPLGLLGVFALYPRVRGAAAIVLTVLLSGALSACMEATQTYLPTRVASKVDLVTNIVGAAVGACAGVWLATPILDRGRVLQLRLQWFDREASLGVIVVVLWFGAILYPQQFALGCGGFLKPFEPTVMRILGLEQGWEPTPSQFSVIEAAVCGTLLCAAGLILLNVMRPIAPRVRLIIGFVAITVVVKIFGAGMSYAFENPLIWVTSGAVTGILSAMVILCVAARASRRARSIVAVMFLGVAMVLVNLVPENPYFDAATGVWAYGRFLNFYGLAYGLSIVWPLVAMGYLVRPGQRLWRHR